VAKNVYLDYNATTPVAPEVLDAMSPWFTERFWNAASSHPMGMVANDAVEAARRQVADLIGAHPNEIVFTSGSTESINLALKGALSASHDRTGIVTAATEHKAVLDTAAWLFEQGAATCVLPVTASGEIDPELFAGSVDEHTAVVSVMAANNETGVIADLAGPVAAARRCGALFHTDATQAVGRINFDVEHADVDLASISAHKIYGPKGVGALYVRRSVRIDAIIHGGGHEHNMRSGTLNVAGIVGFGAAAELAAKQRDDDAEHSTQLTSELVAGLTAQLDGVEVIPESAPRLPNTVNVRFTGADAEAVMVNAPTVAMSSGSACTSMVPHPSHVLIAMGMSADDASECLRFSTGRPTTSEDITEAVAALVPAVTRVRGLTQ
jgi:cysteine desulfurase